MSEPPKTVTDDQVLATVREHWLPEGDDATYLPVGFGAHHWAVTVAGKRRLFVTLDDVGRRHSAESIEDTYAGAAQLASAGLEFATPSLSTRRGAFTAPIGERGRLSVVAWIDGARGPEVPWSREHAGAVAAALARLHAAPAPRSIRHWRPLVGPDLPDELEALVARPWDGGPFGAEARAAVADHVADIRRWSARYAGLGRAAARRAWVPTHGEPHGQNQMLVGGRLVLVDWESLLLAPPERDLNMLVEAGHPDLVEPDWEMAEMFALEWRLDEISGYARWFAAPHTGSENDRAALGDLHEELERREWARL